MVLDLGMRVLRQFFGIWTLKDLANFQSAVFARRSGDELFETVAAFNSVREFVRTQCIDRKFGLLNKELSRASRIAAGEIHTRGQRLVANRSLTLGKEKSGGRREKYLVVHPFVWGHSLCEEIAAHAKGRLGQELWSWVRAEERADVDAFGVDEEFRKRFVVGRTDLYREIERVEGALPGVIYEILRAEV